MISDEMVRVNRRVATEIMGEPMPPPIDESCLENPESPLAREYLPFHTSKGGNWTVIEVYEEGDEPRWEAKRFSENLNLTMRAIEAFDKRIIIDLDFSGVTGPVSVLIGCWHPEYAEDPEEEYLVTSTKELPMSLCQLMLRCKGEEE